MSRLIGSPGGMGESGPQCGAAATLYPRPRIAPPMGRLTDSVDIATPPETVYAWLAHLDEHYVEWHPDHVSCRWLRGGADQVGSVLECVELLHGSRHALRMRIRRAEAPRLIEFACLAPASLVTRGGSFIVEARGAGSRFTASLDFRGGRLLEMLARRRVEALRAHMREEGENLQRLLGRQAAP